MPTVPPGSRTVLTLPGCGRPPEASEEEGGEVSFISAAASSPSWRGVLAALEESRANHCVHEPVTVSPGQLAEAVANRHLVARAEGGKVRVRSAGGGESLAKSGKLLLQRCGKRGALEAMLVEHGAEASEALALP